MELLRILETPVAIRVVMALSLAIMLAVILGLAIGIASSPENADASGARGRRVFAGVGRAKGDSGSGTRRRPGFSERRTR